MSELFDYIESYFSNALSPEEKEIFEMRCISDPVFAEELAIYITIHDHLKRQWYELRKQKLAELEKADGEDFANSNGGKEIQMEVKEEYEPDKQDGSEENDQGRDLKIAGSKTFRQWDSKKGTGKLFLRLAFAATIIGVVALAVTLYLNNEKDNMKVADNNNKIDTTRKIIQSDTSRAGRVTEKNDNKMGKEGRDSPKVLNEPSPDIVSAEKRKALFDNNFKLADAPTDIVESLRIALDHYKNGDYKETIAAIDKVQRSQYRTGELTDEEELSAFYAYYYKAQSYLSLKNIGKAILELKTALDKSPDDSLKSRVQWYLALAYLRQGDMKTTKMWLNELSENNEGGKYKMMGEKLKQQL